MEPMSSSNLIKNECQLRKAVFTKTLFLQRKNNDFQGSEGRSWKPRWTKDQAKNNLKIKMSLGIDFLSILVDLGVPVGVQNRTKIDSKMQYKSGSMTNCLSCPLTNGEEGPVLNSTGGGEG